MTVSGAVLWEHSLLFGHASSLPYFKLGAACLCGIQSPFCQLCYASHLICSPCPLLPMWYPARRDDTHYVESFGSAMSYAVRDFLRLWTLKLPTKLDTDKQ